MEAIAPYDPTSNEPLHKYRQRVLSPVYEQVRVIEEIGEKIAAFDKLHPEAPVLEVFTERLREVSRKAEESVQQKQAARGVERQQLADKLIAVRGWLLRCFDTCAQEAQATDTHKVKTQIRRTVIDTDLSPYEDAPNGNYLYRYGVTVTRRIGLEIYYTAEAYVPRGYEPYTPIEGHQHERRKTAKDKSLVVDWFSRKLLSYAVKEARPMESLYGDLFHKYKGID